MPAWNAAPPAYDEKALKMQVFKAICFVALLKITSGMAMLLFVPIAASVASSPRKKVAAIFSTLLLCTVTTIMGNAVFNHSAAFAISTKAVFLIFSVVLTMKAAGKKWPPALRPIYMLMMFLGFQSVASLFGWAPLISELKILLMILLVTAGANACTLGATGAVDTSKIRTLLLTVCCVIIVGSILAYPFPSISRSMQIEGFAQWAEEGLSEEDLIALALKEDGLYNGLTGHSQMLGPVCAILAAFLVSDYVFNVRKTSRLYVFLMMCAALLVYMTGSRTAMAALVFAMIVCAWMASSARGATTGKKRAWLASVLFSIAAAGTIGVAVVPSIRDRAVGFIMKHSQEEDKELDMEEAFSSRQGLIDRSMYYFRQSPLIGNGFQVMWQMQHRKTYTLKSILSAPIEKGFIPSMLLEEGGIIGTGLFLVFVMSFISACRKYRYYCFLACFLTFLLTNFGEATFFSMSGMGGFGWSISFAAFMLDAERNRQMQSQIY